MYARRAGRATAVRASASIACQRRRCRRAEQQVDLRGRARTPISGSPALSASEKLGAQASPRRWCRARCGDLPWSDVGQRGRSSGRGRSPAPPGRAPRARRRRVEGDGQQPRAQRRRRARPSCLLEHRTRSSSTMPGDSPKPPRLRAAAGIDVTMRRASSMAASSVARRVPARRICACPRDSSPRRRSSRSATARGARAASKKSAARS